MFRRIEILNIRSILKMFNDVILPLVMKIWSVRDLLKSSVGEHCVHSIRFEGFGEVELRNSKTIRFCNRSEIRRPLSACERVIAAATAFALA